MRYDEGQWLFRDEIYMLGEASTEAEGRPSTDTSAEIGGIIIKGIAFRGQLRTCSVVVCFNSLLFRNRRHLLYEEIWFAVWSGTIKNATSPRAQGLYEYVHIYVFQEGP